MIAPIKEKMFTTLFTFALNIFDRMKKTPMPITPPKVFAKRSVISLAPIAKTNCTVSKNKLVRNIGINFLRKGFSCCNAHNKIPKGIKAKTLLYISPKLIVPLTITELRKGIRFTLLK